MRAWSSESKNYSAPEVGDKLGLIDLTSTSRNLDVIIAPL